MKNSKVIFFLLFLILFSGLVVIYFFVPKKSKRVFKPSITPTPTSFLISPTAILGSKKGALILKSADQKLTKSQGEEINLEILADSAEEDIVGYDILLAYDTDNFELIAASSFISDFNLVEKKAAGQLVLTGYKKLSANSVNIWRRQKIVLLRFKAKRKGQFNFKIVEKKGKEKTQLVDVQTKIYYPKVSSLTLEIY